MSNFLKHSEIISSVLPKFEKAKSSGALFFYPSTRSRVLDHGVNFEISMCPALQKKPVLPAPDFAKSDKPDPFSPPYVPDLFVGEIKDELDGDEYAILLNKFSVIPGHFLMVTKAFQPQNTPLTPPDLTQAYLLIRAARKSMPMFAFYNCGVNSGASQPHKHIQFIPATNESEDGEEEDEEASGPPVEAYIRTLKIEDESKVFSLPLPYIHLSVKLDLPKPAQSGTKPLSTDALESLSQALTDSFLKLLDEAVHAVRLYHQAQGSSLSADDTGRASVPSYNILLSGEYMHLIPRLREQTLEELRPEGGVEAEGEAAYTPQKLSVNALGFAGKLLAKSDAELRAIKARGVVALLKQVAVPKIQEEEGAEERNPHA